MAEKHQSGAGLKVDRATWKSAISQANLIQAENPVISSVRVVLPIALLAEKEYPKGTLPLGRKPGKNSTIAYTIDWADKPSEKLEPLSYMEYVTLNHPIHGRSAYFQLELRRWDKTKFRKASSGITHLTKNDRGNVVLRQVVASESATEKILQRFVVYARKFFVQHCEFDE